MKQEKRRWERRAEDAKAEAEMLRREVQAAAESAKEAAQTSQGHAALMDHVHQADLLRESNTALR